jgi:threonine dehydratase
VTAATHEAPVPVRADVDRAAERVAPHVRRTPVLTVAGRDLGVDAGDLVLKLENVQHSGSFKARAVANHFLSRDIGPQGVVAASGGNHGVAVAWGAARFGHRAEVFVPCVAAEAKVRRLERYGAVVHQVGDVFADALVAALDRAARTGAAFLHPYDDPVTVAGAGTLAAELWHQSGGFDTVLVACGGGGLAAGTAAWLDRSAVVVAVEGTHTPTLSRALDAGTPVDVEVGGVTADALGASRLGAVPFACLTRARLQACLVEDGDVLDAQRALWDALQLYVEPSAAAALAALRAGRYRTEPGERVAVVLCGANGDPAQVGRG